MLSIDFTVGTSPVAQPRQRHRIVTTKSGKTHVQNYTPTRHPVTGFKAAVRAAGALARPAGWPLDAAYRVCVVLVRPRLKRHGKKAGTLPANTKPDGDNYVKGVLDALKGVLWSDDGRVYAVAPVKVYAAPGAAAGVRVLVRADDPLAAFDLSALVAGFFN